MDIAALERLAILIVGVYLALIGTWKLRAVIVLRRAMQTHSKRIAAILELVSNLPDGNPTQQAARRAQVYTIARQAREEIHESG